MTKKNPARGFQFFLIFLNLFLDYPPSNTKSIGIFFFFLALSLPSVAEDMRAGVFSPRLYHVAAAAARPERCLVSFPDNTALNTYFLVFFFLPSDV